MAGFTRATLWADAVVKTNALEQSLVMVKFLCSLSEIRPVSRFGVDAEYSVESKGYKC